MHPPALTEAQYDLHAVREQLEADGYAVLRNVIDPATHLDPIWHAIRQIARLIADNKRLPHDIGDADSLASFQCEALRLARVDRSFLSALYDASKQIPAFLRLACSSLFEDIYSAVRNTSLVGIGTSSYGIRFDLPDEDKFRSHWHQEFAFNPQSTTGLVFWVPLVQMHATIGAVEICRGSHRLGPIPHARLERFANKRGIYQVGIPDDETIVGRFETICPLTAPGDLILMDFATLHQSGHNRSSDLRVTMQVRLFDFHAADGAAASWPSDPNTVFGYGV